jgi:hypothetical protein
MTTILHTKIQGLRVHNLTNLGGLVAIAGLEKYDPALLLGAFLNLSQQLSSASMQDIAQLHARGLQKLRERNSEKRTYKYSKSQQETKGVTLQIDDVKCLIIKLGGKIPVFEKDIIPEFNRLMR